MRIPVFVFKHDQTVGSGIHEAVACFVTTGIHVPFTYESHQGATRLEKVGEPAPCDNSCKRHRGIMEDFGARRGADEHCVEKIVEKADAFYSKSNLGQ